MTVLVTLSHNTAEVYVAYLLQDMWQNCQVLSVIIQGHYLYIVVKGEGHTTTSVPLYTEAHAISQGPPLCITSSISVLYISSHPRI